MKSDCLTRDGAVSGELLFPQPADQNVTMLHWVEKLPPYQFARDTFFYWEFLVNDQPARNGIDNTILAAGDYREIQFRAIQSDQAQRVVA